jgi:hypothetical protein
MPVVRRLTTSPGWSSIGTAGVTPAGQVPPDIRAAGTSGRVVRVDR